MTTFSVYDAANEQPARVALTNAGRDVTYAELAQRVDGVAAALSADGMLDGAPAPVALVARASLASIETLLALVTHAAPVLLLHPRLPGAERAALVARASARTVLAPDTQAIPRTRRAPPQPPRSIDPETPLAIVPTSGSTGARKLVILSRRALAASAHASASNLPLSAGDRWLLCLPVAHVGGLSIVTRSLLARTAVVTFDAGERGLLHALPELGACMHEASVTLGSFVPALLDALLALEPPWTPPSSLRALLLGGAATPGALLERARTRGVPLLTTYGLTEAASQVTTTPLGSTPRVESGLVSAGRALAGVELAIAVDGRLRVRGPTLCSGYLDAAAPIDEAGWLVTEDRASVTADGELFVLGRASDLIVTGGENVDPRSVEAALESAAGVRAAVVFGVADARFGEIVACALVPGPDFDLAVVREVMALKLASHERPRRFALVSALPMLENGKLDRRAAQRDCVFEPF